MTRTRRSTSRVTSPMPVSSRKRCKYPTIDTIYQPYQMQQCIGQVSIDLLNTCLLQIRQNIWYSVVPSDNDSNNISSGTRQNWDHIYPLLIHCGLIRKNSDATTGFDVIAPKWDEFVYNFPGLDKLHFIESRRLGEARSFFTCFGKPIYVNPAKQENTIMQ